MVQNNSHDRIELKGGLDSVGEGLDRMRDDITALGHDASDTAQAAVVEVKTRATRHLTSAKRVADQAGDATTNYISKNPFTSIGIALGVGVILGVLAGRQVCGRDS